MSKYVRNILLYVGLPVVIMIIAVVMLNSNTPDALKYSQVIGYFEDMKVREFTVDVGNGDLVMRLDDDKQISYTLANVEMFREDTKPYIDQYNEGKPAEDRMVYHYKPASDIPWLLNLLPTVILIVAFGFLWYFMMKRMSAGMDGGAKTMNFGKAKVKQVADEKRKTTFADVAGADEEKAELQEIVDFLKDANHFNELGARMPKGVLLVGPPGTGKTLLARATAGEAGVPFFSISGSDFVEMFVGVGASRVRDLFEQAKKNSPCIIFIDEIDAVGRQRGAGLGGGHDEREQTLNQLLVEMDGFGANEGVIMIAATNRADILDPALMRPGRFDRQILVGYPDIKGREDILKVHARSKPLAPDVDLSVIAKTTSGFTGADLENLLNESALMAARKGLRAITMEEIEEATIKVVMGVEKRSHVLNEKDKRITSYHEAGHAVVTYYMPTQDPVHQISIIPRGMAGGYTMSLPREDRAHMTKQEMNENIVTLLGGRVAESLVIGDITTGASNDIERATDLAKKMVMKYGMSDKLGPINYASSDSNEVFLGRDFGHTREYSESLASQIDNEVREIIMTAYHRCESMLQEHMDKLHEVANYLLAHEKMDGETFASMMSDPWTKAPQNS
ncbi:ATP-dependent zinc metalloprotease FtsH [Solibaculum mannosilyticum]|uniref:ATP-dependent zinc metalloprotease FtsH n=2 Tax=Solibaculum mannosilyticum TaxID=2780922 RepID=A0A7I8D228_9FIRM|nr:ATP-dependent zinc metalloprotease FtsH [Solibaculum mannosilyticum]CZT55389.1 ATP-dependent zinc metalloprotease FtsH [Eubacteriaceae bacterium CHKCI005]